MRATDDPVAYDTYAISALRTRYDSVLGKVKDDFARWGHFDSPLIHGRDLGPQEWTATARHLLLAFAACEALSCDPLDFTPLWQSYVAIRVVPILRMNECMRRQPALDECGTDLLAASLRTMGALASADQLCATVPHFTPFWAAVSGLYRRMLEAVYEEVLSRYEEAPLWSPYAALAKYDTALSPLLRSSMLEMPLLGLARSVGQVVEPSAWVTDYEKARQLLDDVADVREDLGRGRLTFPVLSALTGPGSGSLRSAIQRAWSQIGDNVPAFDSTAVWFEVKQEIVRLGGYQKSVELIEQWLANVESGSTLTLGGDLEPLLAHVDLKRALLRRLEQSDFDDSPPPTCL
jgi:hypothetical protein